MERRCAQCGSSQVLDVNPVFHASHSVSLRLDTGVFQAPNSMWDKKPVEARVDKATLCVGCGHVALFIADLEEFKASYALGAPAKT
jgi:hypothetical protein